MLNDFQSLLAAYVPDDATTLGGGDQVSAITQAVDRYSTHRPRRSVEDISGTANLLPLPNAWEAGFSELLAMEYPIGKVPPRRLDNEAWTVYQGPSSTQIMLLMAVAGPVRATFSVRHVLTSTIDTIPLAHREAVAKYAASLLCEQLASFYASDTDSTIGADRAQGQTRSQAYAGLARTFRKQYHDALGVVGNAAAPSGQTVSLKPSVNSFGQPPLFHPPRWGG